MKKLFLILISLLLCPLAFPSDAQRQVTKEVTTSETVKSGAGKIYSVSMIATSDDGYVVVHDSLGTNTSANKKVELRESDQYDSDNITFSEGLNCYNGIRVEVVDATAIISYY